MEASDEKANDEYDATTHASPYDLFASLHSSDEEALDEDNEELDPPYESPPPEVCAQLWSAVRENHEVFESFMGDMEHENWCITKLQCSSNDLGQNFLHIAAETGDWRVFSTSWCASSLAVTLPSHSTSAYHASDSLCSGILMYGNTPLHIAATHDHLDFVKALIKYYAQDPINDPLDPTSPHEKVGGVREFPLTTWRMEFVPSTRFLLDRKNHAGLTASEAGSATTANWLENFRKQGSGGIELVAGEESD